MLSSPIALSISRLVNCESTRKLRAGVVSSSDIRHPGRDSFAMTGSQPRIRDDWAASQIGEEADAASPRDDHRQTWQLRCCEAGDHAWRRAWTLSANEERCRFGT